MKFTFYELLKNYEITIPIIQRDYAQGRETANEVRVGFVSKLFDTLTSLIEERSKLHLDFVYGYVRPNKLFIPLDGQQRLTTLFLLHWYIACKEGIINQDNTNTISTETKQLFEKFTYETRISSERFCKALVQNVFVYENDTLLSVTIKDLPWFVSSWQKDPTVSAMLTMLDEIHSKFLKSTAIWDKLINQNTITFEFIDIKSEEFKLTDELYIKMNSRGKSLTQFENFKAQFSDLLNDKKSNYFEKRISYEKRLLSYQQYFSIRIDSAWTDLFWKHKDDLNCPLDTAIERFIIYLTEALYYIQDNELEFKFNQETLEKVFIEEKNVLFLFNVLDFLSSVENLDAYFNSLFCLNETTVDKVKLFGDKSTNLFLRAITNSAFDVTQRILFYGLLYFNTEIDVDNHHSNEKDFLRVLRNLLIKVRQVNTKNRTEYTSNLRLPNLPVYSKFIHEAVKKIKATSNFYKSLSDFEYSGFSADSLENEKEKARLILINPNLKETIFKLEDHNDFQGTVDVIDLENKNMVEHVNAIYEIWSSQTDNSSIVRSLLTYDDYAIQTHYYTAYGKVYYFGTKGSWNRILTSRDEEKEKVSKVLKMLLEDYIKLDSGTSNDKLLSIIENFKSENKDWRYYFITYCEITSESDAYNVYAWTDEEFNIQSLKNAGANPLLAYHMNPYILTLHKRLIESKKFELWPGRYSSSVGAINIKGRLELRSYDEGWEISNFKKGKLTQELLDKYKIIEDGNCLYFKEMKGKDRIETAKAFCEDLLAI